MLKKINIIILLVITVYLFNNVYAKEYYKENEDNNNTYTIIDEVEILNDEQILKIQNQMKNITEYGHVSLRIVSKEVEYEELGPIATEEFNNWKTDGNSLMVYINVKNDVEPKIYNNIYIKNSGFNISDEDLMQVVWKVTPTLRKGEIEETIYQTFDNIHGLCVGEKEGVYTVGSTITSTYRIVMEDDANLLTEMEEEKLKDKMSTLTKYGNIAFKSISENNTSAPSYASSYYHNIFGTESGTLFLIDMDNRKIYIFSDGDNYKIITDGKADIITDNIYQFASKEEYYNCAYNAFDQIETLLEGNKISEPMRYISNMVVSIVTAFFINFIIVWKASNIKKSKYNEILNGCEINFQANNITGIKTGTHRVYAPVSDSSSSGGSSGGGGGGSSGGGGGHSF